jgi:hypothetical protein
MPSTTEKIKQAKALLQEIHNDLKINISIVQEKEDYVLARQLQVQVHNIKMLLELPFGGDNEDYLLLTRSRQFDDFISLNK